MRFVYAHFPINVVLGPDGSTVEVRNFLGEKRNRLVVLPKGVKAVRSEKVKDEIVLSGNDVDDVSQMGMLQLFLFYFYLLIRFIHLIFLILEHCCNCIFLLL